MRYCIICDTLATTSIDERALFNEANGTLSVDISTTATTPRETQERCHLTTCTILYILFTASTSNPRSALSSPSPLSEMQPMPRKGARTKHPRDQESVSARKNPPRSWSYRGTSFSGNGARIGFRARTAAWGAITRSSLGRKGT